MPQKSALPPCRHRRNEAGITLIEILISASLLMMTSLSLAYAYSSTGLVSRDADRTVAVQASVENTLESLADVAFDQLLAWNGINIDRGDHTVAIAVDQVQVGLILVELIVTDDNSGAIVSRLVTYRSGD